MSECHVSRPARHYQAAMHALFDPHQSPAQAAPGRMKFSP
ncbi:hypothetical protein SJ05684_b45870 (plasmid) [Sinorhizobium sojae CCBAU 05684]|uniref:Uncharacterized protein n=1 Tax=Sinorhizobium sojae CCBAU 05684 TaxID=716928 RepID=A0A249PJS2_9HYPH|nr:hypothetical protein SJ05684_b45870 [Sinorhizobium sojae CCBAU 05684]